MRIFAERRQHGIGGDAMSITQYNGIIERTKASITVSVQRVDRAESGVFVPAMLPNSREYFSSVQTAEYAYPDVFDHTATFFHIKDDASIAPFYSCGFASLSTAHFSGCFIPSNLFIILMRISLQPFVMTNSPLSLIS